MGALIAAGAKTPSYCVEDYIIDEDRRVPVPLAAYNGKNHRELDHAFIARCSDWSETEAQTVRHLFARYLTLKSVRDLVDKAASDGL